ncbi:MAG: hypothetical protein RIA62_00120 [Cyclobacteriaceae bacterium]
MNKEKNIDALIKEALSKEEAEYYDKLEEKPVLKQFAGLYRGKNSWMNYLVAFYILAAIAGCVYAGFQFAAAESTKELLVWSLVMLATFIMTAMLKIWSWMQMDKGELIREIKRLELQLSVIAGKRK